MSIKKMKGPLGRGCGRTVGALDPIPNRPDASAEIPRGPRAGVRRAVRVSSVCNWKSFAAFPEAQPFGERNGSYARTVISGASLAQRGRRFSKYFWPPAARVGAKPQAWALSRERRGGKKKGRRGAGVLVGPQAGRNVGCLRTALRCYMRELICWTPALRSRFNAPARDWPGPPSHSSTVA